MCYDRMESGKATGGERHGEELAGRSLQIGPESGSQSHSGGVYGVAMGESTIEDCKGCLERTLEPRWKVFDDLMNQDVVEHAPTRQRGLVLS
jgi:hypothetical protein